MSSTSASSHEAASSPGGPFPLTKVTRDGRRYVRHADVEEEIRVALAARPASWVPESLKSETLVHLIRSLRWRDEMTTILGRLFDQLGRRVARIARDNSKGFSGSLQNEISEHVSHTVVQLILAEAPTKKSEFLEVVFRKVVKGLTLNEVEKRRQEPQPHQFAPLQDDPENAADQSSVLRDEGPGPEDIAQSREICELVRVNIDAVADPRHREAVVLHYLQGWPITDKDPTTLTLRNYFGVSGRQIHNWIKGALAEIRISIGEEQ